MIFERHASINNKRGFTIVELLIVIVVIGILAAIAFVSYTGAQNSAYSAKASSVADSYVKLFKMYKVEHGNYPVLDGDACLGDADNYPAEGTFVAGQCIEASDDSPSGANASVDEGINSALKEHTDQLPNADLPTVTLRPAADVYVSYRGIFYIGNDPGGPSIGYALSGDQTCPKGERTYMEEMNFTGCTIYLDA